MALTPNWKTNAEGEEEYIDKGAVTTPQINPEVDKKYMAARAEGKAVDKVEWPTKTAGQTDQYA
jgi:hypothetical protein